VGNTAVRDAVSSGECDAGLIDTSDANEAKSYGKAVDIIYPDQESGGLGVFLIPNTVALVKNGPNPENGRKLIDYLLRRETEEKLAYSASAQIPLRSIVSRPESVPYIDDLKLMDVDYNVVAGRMDYSNEFLLDLFATT
ncbi:MAG: extracellular solute-binding protein, partial [Candidatus Altiarchaeota archaeon]|nr:extracellular solute-binding protein [Candidatus Altiarchaeota archaeon]